MENRPFYAWSQIKERQLTNQFQRFVHSGCLSFYHTTLRDMVFLLTQYRPTSMHMCIDTSMVLLNCNDRHSLTYLEHVIVGGSSYFLTKIRFKRLEPGNWIQATLRQHRKLVYLHISMFTLEYTTYTSFLWLHLTQIIAHRWRIKFVYLYRLFAHTKYAIP